MLTQDKLRKYFYYKDGMLFQRLRRAGVRINNPVGAPINSTGYRSFGFFGSSTLLHRAIFLYYKGFLPKIVDHIDQDKTNNRIENLRESTRSGNGANRKKYSRTREYKGVERRGGSYRSRIRKDGKEYHIGSFKTAKEAAIAYDIKAIELHGDFSYTNFKKENYGL